MRKYCILPLFCAMLSLSAQADDKVVIVTTTGQQAYNTDDVDRITLTDDALRVLTVDGNGTTYAFDEVVKIVLSSSATGIDTPEAQQEGRLTLTVSPDGTRLTVNGWTAGEQATVSIYSAGGALIQRHTAWTGQPVDISTLTEGVYIIHAGTHTAKFRK